MSERAEKIRNIALIGHSGEGKTTLAEAILYNAKAIDRQGKVDDGNSTMDFDPEEIAKKISISLAVANCEYKGYKFNLLDVPGFFDFEGEMVEALSAADSAIIVTGGSGSLTVGTEKALDYLAEHKIPAMIFITGLDKDNSSYTATVNAIKAKYGSKIVQMVVPHLEKDKFAGWVGVIDRIGYNLDGTENPAIFEAHKDELEELKMSVSESAAENDEALLDKFFGGEELTGEEIAMGLGKGILECSSVPVYGGSALTNKGVLCLMDKIIAMMPSPAATAGVKAKTEDGKDVVLTYDDSKPVVLRVFKTTVDPFVGRLNIFKVIQGTLKSGLTLNNVAKGSSEKISSLYFLKGKKQEPTDSVVAGDIGALAKLTDVTTGDTLCESTKYIFPAMQIPAPVYSMAVYAAKKGDEDKIFAGLSKLKDEDISFTVSKNAETNEMLLSGVGETQLSILCKKLKNKFNCEAVLKEPRIAYRETVRKMAEAEGKHKKQSGGAGQFGVCNVRFEPGAEDGVYEFVDAVVGGAVPRQFIPAVDKGLREAIKTGVLAGYPMVNLKCTLFDGKYHPVDSKEIAFVTAAKLAFAEGVANASPCILEPIMRVDITIPSDYLGDVMGDMNKRRGRILGTDQVGNKTIVSAEAPQGELAKYATDLRSMTQGRGSFTTAFERYEEVPPMAQEKIIKEAKEAKAE